jgi:hypothetical protein
MAPVAAILCGRQPKMAEFMINALGPKIEGESHQLATGVLPARHVGIRFDMISAVVHVCSNQDAATSEIPALLKGEKTAPSSGMGGNAGGESFRSDVGMIIIGGGYSKDDVQAIQAAAESVKPLPIFWADVSKTAGSGPPTPDVIKDRILEAVEKDEKGEGEWETGIHMY